MSRGGRQRQQHDPSIQLPTILDRSVTESGFGRFGGVLVKIKNPVQSLGDDDNFHHHRFKNPVASLDDDILILAVTVSEEGLFLSTGRR